MEGRLSRVLCMSARPRLIDASVTLSLISLSAGIRKGAFAFPDILPASLTVATGFTAGAPELSSLHASVPESKAAKTNREIMRIRVSGGSETL